VLDTTDESGVGAFFGDRSPFDHVVVRRRSGRKKGALWPGLGRNWPLLSDLFLIRLAFVSNRSDVNTHEGAVAALRENWSTATPSTTNNMPITRSSGFLSMVKSPTDQ
jgi:hypothetical protein